MRTTDVYHVIRYRRRVVYMYTNPVSYGVCRLRVAVAAVVMQSARPGAAQTVPSPQE